LLAFVVLGLVFSVLSQEIGWEEGGQKIATLFHPFLDQSLPNLGHVGESL